MTAELGVDSRPAAGEVQRETRPPHVVIVVENNPVPRDRRVWRECLSLRDAGFAVSVVAPAAEGGAGRHTIDGVSIYAYPARDGSGSAFGLAVEYASAMVWSALMLLRIAATRRVDVIQACNPPDLLFLLALPFRLFGTPFVFDHHDLSPEMYDAKFPKGNGVLRTVLLLCERLTLRAATRVITTNESMREVAIRRGGKAPGDVVVVRNGPDPTVMRPRDARPELRRGRAHLCTYVGVMGSQDGVEFLVAAIDDYVRTLGRDDCTFALLGDGECLPEIRREVERRGLSDYVDLPGWQDDDGLFAYLSTSDLGLCPEPPTPLNQMSTMVKTAEYMAFELPVVALDLQETRVTAGSCGRYATTTDPLAYARLVAELLDDPMTRRELGTAARRRVVDTLAWSHQQTAYVDVYRSLLSGD